MELKMQKKNLEIYLLSLHKWVLPKKPIKLVISFSVRCGDGNVYLDATVAPHTTHEVADLIRSLNLHSYKVGIKDEFKFFTNLAVGDIVNDFDLDNIMKRLCHLLIVGEGSIQNIRTFIKIFKEGVKYLKSENKQKNVILVTSIIMMFTTIENLGLKVQFNPKELRDTIVETLGAFKVDYKELCDEANANVGMGMLPMAIGMMESFKPMVEPYMGLLSNLNFDRFYVNVNAPAMRACLRVGVHFPGCTEFLDKNLFF